MNNKATKIILITLVMLAGCFGIAMSEDTSKDTTVIEETVGSTNYVGLAKVFVGVDAPTTSESVWMVIKTVDAGSIKTTKIAYNTNNVGEYSKWSSVWDDRATLTYK